eukprot:3162941-Amphidinium_carterae.2
MVTLYDVQQWQQGFHNSVHASHSSNPMFNTTTPNDNAATACYLCSIYQPKSNFKRPSAQNTSTMYPGFPLTFHIPPSSRKHGHLSLAASYTSAFQIGAEKLVRITRLYTKCAKRRAKDLSGQFQHESFQGACTSRGESKPAI